MLTWTLIGLWLALGAFGWWIYFRRGIRQLRTESWGFVTLMSIFLVLTFVCTAISGPCAFALLIDGEPTW